MYRVRHKSINTSLSHEPLFGGLQDGGRGTHVTHFLQLYPQPLYEYTASQVRTTCRSWDEGVLTDVCLIGALTDLCLTRYFAAEVWNDTKWRMFEGRVEKHGRSISAVQLQGVPRNVYCHNWIWDECDRRWCRTNCGRTVVTKLIILHFMFLCTPA